MAGLLLVGSRWPAGGWRGGLLDPGIDCTLPLVMDALARPAALVQDRARTYASFVKLEHALFSLPLIVAGALIGSPDGVSLSSFAWIAVAATGARTAALGLNRLLDHGLDLKNPRTRARELPAGRMGVKEAWGVVAAGTGFYLLGAAFLQPICLVLSPIPLLVFAGYPLLKRVTPLCHFGVGTALALAPLAGHVAVRGDLRAALVEVGPLALFTLFWVSGFDIIYATLDEAFDRETGIHSLPAALGRERALLVSRACHLLALVVLVAWAWSRWPSVFTALPLAIVAAGLAWQQRAAANVELAFFRINSWLGFAVLLVVIAGRLSVGSRL